MGKYFKTGVISILLFGVSMFACYYFLLEQVMNALMGVMVAAVAFGIGIGVASYYGDKQLRERGYDVSSTNLNQQLNVKVTASPEQVFERCKRLELFKRIDVHDHDARHAKIVARTALTWKSFGETVQIIIRKINETQTRVCILSRPALKTTLLDFGKNLENVVTIKETLMNCFGDAKSSPCASNQTGTTAREASLAISQT